MSVSVLGCNITYFMCVLSIWLVAVHFQWCWNSASVINTLNFAMILSLMYIFYIFYIFTYFTYFSVTPKLVGRQPESNINNFILSLLRKLGWSDSRNRLFWSRLLITTAHVLPKIITSHEEDIAAGKLRYEAWFLVINMCGGQPNIYLILYKVNRTDKVLPSFWQIGVSEV